MYSTILKEDLMTESTDKQKWRR